ncbi:hypothetical protein [Pantoea graminicola]|uniref:hypothetical protein n=1 Tax=Pantoea sp. ARC607 TaxID=2027922 RepID=UPI0011B6CFA9|nr:hypothetical protein [Pantoea sp. ARC607]
MLTTALTLAAKDMRGEIPALFSMKQVRYLKSTHDAHAGEKRFLRDDHAEVLRLTGFVEFIDNVEKQSKGQKKK